MQTNESLQLPPYVSRGKNSFKLSIPKPEGGYIYKNIGCKRVGETEGLRKALLMREKLGKEQWGNFWKQLKQEPDLLKHLPRSLEPLQRVASDRNSHITEYVANWTQKSDMGEFKKYSRRYSAKRHGLLGAYTKAKLALHAAYQEYIPLLEFMGRTSQVKLQ